MKKKNDVIKVHMKLIKKKCFEALFKIDKGCAFLMSTGKEFQRVGAATEKERAP